MIYLMADAHISCGTSDSSLVVHLVAAHTVYVCTGAGTLGTAVPDSRGTHGRWNHAFSQSALLHCIMSSSVSEIVKMCDARLKMGFMSFLACKNNEWFEM